MNHWDQRFDRPDYLFGEEPNAFLVRAAGHIPPGGKVLAVADGEGRNGVWLARQGHDVHAVEASGVALNKARSLAVRHGVTVRFEQADLTGWTWPEGAYDAVVGIFIQFAGPDLRAQMFAGMKRALKPGGVLLLEGYRPEQLAYGTGGPKAVENLYDEALLRTAFADCEIVELASYDAEVAEGPGHHGMSALIDLVARRPA